MHRRGFTRIELLMVLALIGVQDALLVLGVPLVREAARRAPQWGTKLKPTGPLIPDDPDAIGSGPLNDWGSTAFLPQPWEVRPFVGLNDEVAPSDRPLSLSDDRHRAAPNSTGGRLSEP